MHWWTTFSDALDSKSKKAGTYLGMLESNVQTIVSSLK